MSEGSIDAGSLHLDVVLDTSGLAREAQAKITAETAKVKARIKAEIDAARAKQQLDAIAKRDRIAQIKVEIEEGKARASLDALAEKRRVAQIRVAADVAKAQRDIDTVAATQRLAQIKVEAATEKARADLETFSARKRTAEIRAEVAEVKAKAQLEALARPRTAKVRVDIDTTAINKASRGLSMFGGIFGTGAIWAGIAAGISLAAGALAQVAAGLFAVVSAAAPAVGILGAIPGLLGVAVQGIGSLILGFGGVGDAVKAMGQAQQSAATQAGAMAAAQEAAAARVAAAQDRIKQTQEAAAHAAEQASEQIVDAQQTVADATERASRSVADAERRLVDSQRDALQAQLDLSAARRQAVRDLEDLNNAVIGGRLSVEAAEIGLDRAAMRKDQTDSSNTSTGLDRRQADLDFREAQQRLKEAQLQQKRLEADSKAANKAGIDGSDAVVDARNRLAEANRKALESEADLRQAQIDGARDVSRAQEQLARTIRSSSRSITQAQHAVALAQRDLADAQASATKSATTQTAAQTALTAAMEKLSPAGQDFARFLQGTLIPTWGKVKKAAQDALLPPVQAGLTAILPLFGVLARGIAGSAGVMGKAFQDLAEDYLATPLFQSRFTAVMDNNSKALGIFLGGLGPLIRLFVALSLAAQPMIERFAKFTTNLLKSKAAMAETGEASGRLQAFFKTAGDTLALLVGILSDLGRGFLNMGKAASDSGGRMLTSLADLTSKWADWTGSIEGQSALKDYFDQAEPTLRAVGRLIADITKAIFRLGNDPALAGLIEQIRTEMLPSVERVAAALNATLGPAIIDLFTNLADLIADISEAGGGGLAAFVRTLDAMVVALDRLVSNPAIGPFIQTLLSVAGVAAAFALVGGAIGGVVRPIVNVIGFLGPLLMRIGLLSKAAAALRTAFLFAGRALLGPWGLAIAAVVGGLIYAYKNFEGFRKVVDTVVAAVVGAAQRLWERGIKPAFWGIVNFITGTLAPALVDLHRSVVVPVFGAIGRAISWWWNNVTRPVFQALVDFWTQVVGPAVTYLWKGIIQPIFGLIGRAISLWWNNIVKPQFAALVFLLQRVVFPIIRFFYNNVVAPIFRLIGLAVKATVAVITSAMGAFTWLLSQVVGPAIRFLVDKVIRPYFAALGQVIKFTWEKVVKPILDSFKSGLGLLGDKVKGVVDGIKTTWDRLRDIFSGPIKFVVDTVYTNGIKKVWDSVAKLVGAPTLGVIKFATGGVAQGPDGRGSVRRDRAIAFARGGVLPGYAPGVDSIRAILSPGEGILVPEAVRGLARQMGTTASGAIQTINSTFSRRVAAPDDGHQHYALGGIADFGRGVAQRARSVGAWAREGIGDTLGKIGGIALGSIKSGMAAALAPLRKLMDQALGTRPPLTDGIRRVALRGMDSLTSFGGEKDAAGLTGGGFARGGSWPRATLGVLASNTAAAVAYVRDRWDAINSIGTLGSRPNRSDHPMGKALDAMIPGWERPPGVALGNQIASFFAENAQAFGTKYVIWRDKINSGAGWRPYTHPNGPTDNPTLQHRDHVHVSLLDQGGRLKPGLNVIRNETGQDEPVLNPEQWATTQRALSLVERVAASTPRPSTLQSVPTQATAARGLTIEKFEVVARDTETIEELARRVSVEMAWLVR